MSAIIAGRKCKQCCEEYYISLGCFTYLEAQAILKAEAKDENAKNKKIFLIYGS